MNAIYAFAPPAPQSQLQVLDQARTAYLKATGAISDEAKSSEKKRSEEGGGGKRKDAVGEDCPVYVSLISSLVFFYLCLHFDLAIFSSGSSSPFTPSPMGVEYSRTQLIDRCYEEMTNTDVGAGLLVWDESDLGCGKGELIQPVGKCGMS